MFFENHDALQEYLRREKIVVLQFGSETCGPCKAIQKKIELWNMDHPRVQYLYISADSMPEACAQMGVFTVPTVFVYVEGKMTIRKSGCFSLDEILSKTEQYEKMIFE